MKILVPNQPFFDHSSHKRKLEERDGTSQDSQPAAIEANISPDTDSEQQATTETTSQNSADGFPFRHLTNGGVLDGEIAWEIPPGYFRYEFVGEVPHKIRKSVLILETIGLCLVLVDTTTSALTYSLSTIGVSE